MIKPSQRIPDIVFSTGILCVGAFAYLETLLFRPKVLTAYMSGVQLLLPVDVQTIISVCMMIIFGVIAFLISGRHSRPFDALRFLVLVIFPLAGSVLAVTVMDATIPPLVSLLLGASCIFQLKICLDTGSESDDVDVKELVIQTLLCVCVSSLLTHAIYTLAPTDAVGSTSLAALMALTGILVFYRYLFSPVWEQAGLLQGSRRITLLAKPVILLLPAGVLCALNMGLSWNDPQFGVYLRSPWYFPLAIVLTAIFMLALRRLWQQSDRLTVEALLFAMVVPTVAGILAFLMKDYLPTALNHVLLLFSNLSYLALFWIGMLYYGSSKVVPLSLLPVIAVLILIVIFAIGVAASSLLPIPVLMALGSMMLVIFLIFTIIFGIRELRRNASLKARSLKLIRDESVAGISQDFHLSKRESEVLSLLVMGLSAPAIGKKLFLSAETIKTHKYHIYQKMAIHTQEEIVAIFESYVENR